MTWWLLLWVPLGIVGLLAFGLIFHWWLVGSPRYR